MSLKRSASFSLRYSDANCSQHSGISVNPFLTSVQFIIPNKFKYYYIELMLIAVEKS